MFDHNARCKYPTPIVWLNVKARRTTSCTYYFVPTVRVDNRQLFSPLVIQSKPASNSLPLNSRIMTTNFNDSTTSGLPNMSLERLPTEILFHIADWLTIPELRILGRANRQFAGFVNGYCKVYQYKLGLFRLPQSVLQQIIGHLDTIMEQSRFARTSHKLYAVVMESLLSTAEAEHKSALLIHAAMSNNVPLAQKVVRFGGDVNRQQTEAYYHRGPPLSTSIEFGHADMVCFLLQAGASQLDHRGSRGSLQDALRLGHDEVALVLCEGLSQKDTTLRWGPVHSILSEACEFGRSVVVESLLARGHPGQTPEESIHTRSQTLHRVLRMHACEGSLVVDGKLVAKPLDDVFKVTKLLLEYGADPDMKFDHWVHSMYLTESSSRKWGKHSPDPRIRALFSTGGTKSAGDSKTSSQEKGKSNNDRKANGQKGTQPKPEAAAPPKDWRKKSVNCSGIDGSWRRPEALPAEPKPAQFEWRKKAGPISTSAWRK